MVVTYSTTATQPYPSLETGIPLASVREEPPPSLCHIIPIDTRERSLTAATHALGHSLQRTAVSEFLEEARAPLPFCISEGGVPWALLRTIVRGRGLWSHPLYPCSHTHYPGLQEPFRTQCSAKVMLASVSNLLEAIIRDILAGYGKQLQGTSASQGSQVSPSLSSPAFYSDPMPCSTPPGPVTTSVLQVPAGHTPPSTIPSAWELGPLRAGSACPRTALARGPGRERGPGKGEQL